MLASIFFLPFLHEFLLHISSTPLGVVKMKSDPRDSIRQTTAHPCAPCSYLQRLVQGAKSSSTKRHGTAEDLMTMHSTGPCFLLAFPGFLAPGTFAAPRAGVFVRLQPTLDQQLPLGLPRMNSHFLNLERRRGKRSSVEPCWESGQFYYV